MQQIRFLLSIFLSSLVVFSALCSPALAHGASVNPCCTLQRNDSVDLNQFNPPTTFAHHDITIRSASIPVVFSDHVQVQAAVGASDYSTTIPHAKCNSKTTDNCVVTITHQNATPPVKSTPTTPLQKITQPDSNNEPYTAPHIRIFDHATRCCNNTEHYVQRQPQFVHDVANAMKMWLAGYREITSAEYGLTDQTRSILDELYIDPTQFAYQTGNVIQIVKHTEIAFLANEFGLLYAQQSSLKPLVYTMYGFVDAARESNGECNIKAATHITDFCWDILDYAQDYAKKCAQSVAMGTVAGAINGVALVAHLISSPRETGTALCNAGSFLGGIVACSFANHLALETYQQCQSLNMEYEFQTDAFEHLNATFTTIQRELDNTYNDFKAKSGQEKMYVISAGLTEWVVSGIVFGKLIQGTSALFKNAIVRLKMIAKNLKKGTQFEHIAVTAGNAEIKIALETANQVLEESVTTTEKMIGTAEGAISSGTRNTAAEIAAWEATLGGETSLIAAEGNAIKKFTTKVVKDKWEHTFSLKHLEEMQKLIGLDTSEIMNSMIDIIKQADIEALLREGDTAIKTTINSHNFLIKIFIQEGEVMGINGYLSDFKRIWPHTVYVKGT